MNSQAQRDIARKLKVLKHAEANVSDSRTDTSVYRGRRSTSGSVFIAITVSPPLSIVNLVLPIRNCGQACN